ncbi:processed acidic surface protein [Neobacillus sp. 114]|uniref:processed acidic surface protein n=1 Tax=Neobacillus sp. 114 TaxID=3048535 RepID=UPI001C22F278|nr:processed acidic surface protein [Neobacillus sp. 114]MBU8915519.1 processed acidic surface protein [Bacillus sp. FJAT-29953]
MNIKRIISFSFILFMFLFSVPFVSAAPTDTELNQYLQEIGWTKQELQDYLDFYEIPLDEFASIDELREFLGTPINEQNLQELLTKYHLSQKELDDLLNHFGDSLGEYKFIEDLDSALDFYVNHDKYMADIESELNEIGITEEESEKFFNYLGQVEEKNRYQLDQMDLYDSLLEKFVGLDDTTDLTEEQLDELVQILTETIETYEIKVQFKVNNQNISLKELLKMKEAPDNLYVGISSIAGEHLIDFTIPGSYFQTGETIDQGELMIHLGEISNEFIDHLHDEKYQNADNRYK